MSTQDQIVEQGRTAAESVVQRADGDQGFADRFRKEPVAVLLEAGAPAEAVSDILRETGFDQEEVSGYLLSAGISPSLSLGSPLGASRPGVSTPLGGINSKIGAIPGSAADCSFTCVLTDVSCQGSVRL